MAIKAVFFDVGETLIDETRQWGEWADYLGVPRLTFFAALGAVIERGEDHRRVFEFFRPGVGYPTLRRMRDADGDRYHVKSDDFYPDALPCLRSLREAGYQLGIAGNQPVEIEGALRRPGVPVDVIASSASWGVEKPSLGFFERIVESTGGLKPHEIAYVGDRIDNDIEPASRVGMTAIFIRRGPWAVVQSAQSRFTRPQHTISELGSLLDFVARLGA